MACNDLVAPAPLGGMSYREPDLLRMLIANERKDA